VWVRRCLFCLSVSLSLSLYGNVVHLPQRDSCLRLLIRNILSGLALFQNLHIFQLFQNIRDVVVKTNQAALYALKCGNRSHEFGARGEDECCV